MELKVWVEGIQRIVCGVTERTTCQDVVYALAHATGKTGRFTLIERWRNNERLLAPQEHPLKVLLKWGEYSNDVHFILQRSPLDKSPSPHPGRPSGQAFKITTPTSTSVNDSPETPTNESPATPSGANTSPPTRELKKSLTFSGGHPAGDFTSRRMGIVKGVPQTTPSNMPDVLNTSVDSIQSNSSLARLRTPSQSPRPTELRIPGAAHVQQPPPYRDPPLPSSRGASPAGTNVMVSSPRPPNRELPQPPPYRDPPKPRGQSPLANGVPKQLSGKEPPAGAAMKWASSEDRIDLNSSWASRSSRDSPLRLVEEEVDLLSHSCHRRSTSPVKRNLLQEFQATDGLPEGDRHIGHTGVRRVLPTIVQPRPPSPPRDPQFGSMVQLLNRQREKLEAQQAELSQYEADIQKYEQKAREREAVLDAVVQESARLEELSQQAEEQIAILEGAETDLENAQAQEVYLGTEIQACQSKLAEYDQELQALRDQMRSLISDIRGEEKATKDVEQQQSREHEDEFDRLSADLGIARKQSELCGQVEQQMDKEITSLEQTLVDKKVDLDRLVADIKQANLQSLSIVPVEEARQTVEGIGLLASGPKSGSGRRMIGSPRQLETAVPTNKNPHGVWV